MFFYKIQSAKNNSHTLLYNNTEFQIEYSISRDNSVYELKVLELVDCNFDNDTNDYFYYNSNDSIYELLFYDKENILDVIDFRDSCRKRLNDTLVSSQAWYFGC